MKLSVVAVAVAVTGILGGQASAQNDQEIGNEDQQPFNGLQAGEDAYQRAEALRQQRIVDQGGLEDAIQDYRTGVGNPAYYRAPFFGGYGSGYSGAALRGSVTAAGTWGGGVGGYGAYGYQGGYSVLNGFQNHYYVTPLSPMGGAYYLNGPGGGVYRPGYAIVTPAYPTPLRQPTGQWNGQTGPNRWESHPVYGDERFPDEEADPDEAPPPRPTAGPIVKPKIIVPPPKREY